MSATLIGVIVVVVLLVKGTLGAAGKNVTHSVFIKILLNHMQMLVIVMVFDMQWPQFI